MASVKNITMREYNGTDYDTLYPKTIASQVDGVYNKTEINTFLANKAPAGYGLGGQSKFISSSDDLNDAVYDGWYYFDAPPINAPLFDGVNALGYSSMLVSNRIPSLYVTQEIFCYNSWEAFNCVLRRCRINGEWKPWEWVNPPMALGIEYRTTERRNGSPVYCKYANLGKLTNGSYGEISVDSLDVVVAYEAMFVNRPLPIINNSSLTDAGTQYVNVFAHSGTIIRVYYYGGANVSGNGDVYVLVKYTKNA